MKKTLISTLALLIGNAVGLLLASLLLSGFSIDFLSFVIVVIVFTVASSIAMPLLRKVSEKNAPQLMGAAALITIFVGLIVTEIFVAGFSIGGISNLLASTLLVWLGALIAGILLPIYVFKSLKEADTK